MKRNLVIGIVGGMGPQAGITLFNSILCNTHAHTDQEHLSAIMISFPGDIVDRTEFLEGRTEVNPAYKIAEIIGKLEAAGAEIIGMACNTSYAPRIYNVIQQLLLDVKSRVKLLHMPLETCRAIREMDESVRRVGIMCTNGAYKAGIYENVLTEWGYEVVMPTPEFQNDVIQRLIYDPAFGIKSNPTGISREVQSLLQEAFRFFRQNGTEAIILGCTELSVVITGNRVEEMLLIDSTRSLAKALIREASGVYPQSLQPQYNIN